MEETISLVVPRAAAERVAKAWELDQLEVPFVTAIRDMLNGQDGHLHTLNAALGRDH